MHTKADQKEYKGTRQRVSAPTPFGMSLLLVTFLILCLFTFSAISLAAARNDARASQKSGERIAAYYQASDQAEEKLDALNRQAAKNPASATEAVSFQIGISSGQALAVELVPEKDPSGSTLYHIRRWEVVSTGEPQPEPTIPVLQIK